MKTAEMKLLIILLSLTFICRCVQSPVTGNHTGSGSDVQACLIRSAVVDSTGNPVEGASAKIRRADFISDNSQPFPEDSGLVFTDSNGAFEFSITDTGEYSIEVNDVHSGASLINCSVQEGDSLIELPAAALAPIAQVSITLPENAPPVSVYIKGLDRYAYLTDSIAFNVPQGHYTFVFEHSSSSSQSQISDVFIQSGSAMSLGEFDFNFCCHDFQCDSITLSQILSFNEIELSSPDISFIRDTESGRITELYLENSAIYSIPPEIGRLSQLSKLHIRNTSVTTLPFEIGFLKNLTELMFDNNNLMFIPEIFETLPKLTMVDISNNQIESLPHFLQNLPNFTELNAANNRIVSIPIPLLQNATIRTLNLSNNLIREIPEVLPMLPSLRHLDLSSNQLYSLPAAITSLTDIEYLNIDYNMLCSVDDSIKEWLDYYAPGWQQEGKQSCDEAIIP